MSAQLATAAGPEARLEPLTPAWLAQVMAVEKLAYGQPWSERNFTDSLASGYQATLLVASSTLLGYFVAMPGVEEVHLLNLTVAPAYQRQGWSSLLLQALTLWARGQAAKTVWLEVRASNRQALAVYQHHGFAHRGLRKGYYPTGGAAREDAVVMCRTL
jgi:ribosomal-protein-alanine N-acetyltransferase